MSDFLASSDSVRTAKPLQYAQCVTFSEPMKLELGATLREVTVCYETYGRLNEAKDNAVLVCHALSSDSHVARHDDSDDPGWWELSVGPGKAIDTDKYFVICSNILGGCRGTTGPNSINPDTGNRYGRDFPTTTIGDMVDLQKRLIEHMGIRTLLAAVGGSMGGMQVLAWSTKYPQLLRGAIPIATAPRLTSQSLAFDVVGRNVILHDPNFHGGNYYDRKTVPNVGLAIARMIGHITYLSPESMKQKFDIDRLQPREVATEFEKKFSVGSYLGYKGDKFVEIFDANSYIAITMAMDLFDLGAGADLSRSLSASACRWLIISFSSDWLFPPSQSQEMVQALINTGKPVSYCNVASDCGHDAFLLPNDLATYGGLIRGFLADLAGEPTAGLAYAEKHHDDATSIFHTQRLDYERILELIPPSASVLDLGCGNGGLLARLKRRGHPEVRGVELDEQEILACVSLGLDVVQADINRGLASFLDSQFDYVVLSQTLQTVRDVEAVIGDMLRVGRRSVVSFPNFAYHKLRRMLVEEGKAPEATGGLLRHKWYNSPNIRFLSLADFETFCQEKNIHVHRRIALDTEARREVTEDPNLNADLAIFVISR